MPREVYQARKSPFSSYWRVEQEIPCINGLSAWFVIADVHEPDEQEIGYTDGAIGSAEQRATAIARALNEQLARSLLPNGPTMPEKCSKAVAMSLSRLNYGFNNGERVEDGRKNYDELRKLMLKEQEK